MTDESQKFAPVCQRPLGYKYTDFFLNPVAKVRRLGEVEVRTEKNRVSLRAERPTPSFGSKGKKVRANLIFAMKTIRENNSEFSWKFRSKVTPRSGKVVTPFRFKVIP